MCPSQRKCLVKLWVPKRRVPFAATSLIQDYPLDLVATTYINESHHSFFLVIGNNDGDVGPIIALQGDRTQECGILLVPALEYRRGEKPWGRRIFAPGTRISRP